MDDIIWLSATEITRRVRARDLSAREVVETHLRRIEGVNPRLNAVVQVDGERALASADAADEALARGDEVGPLHGLPVTIKDNIPVAGLVMTNGTLGLKGNVVFEDAPVVSRLKAAGAIVIGKTNLPEIGMSGETDNLVYGRTNNPYDLECSPGGSSGGESAIIAAGGSPLGIGTDIGGSIRYPAHCCGIAGIKPTMGRVPWHVPYGYGDELRQTGPLARYVEDLTLTLPIISGPDWRDPSAGNAPLGDPATVEPARLRIAIQMDNGVARPTVETQQAVALAANALSTLGATVEEASPPGLLKAFDLFSRLLGASGGAQFRDTLERAGTTEEQISPEIREYLAVCERRAMSTADFQRVILEWDQFRSDVWRFFADYDALIAPVFSHPAVKHGGERGHIHGLSYTSAYNLAGLPGAVVRAGTSPEGLPIGVQVIAGAWQEHIALAIAHQIESIGGWQPPAI